MSIFFFGMLEIVGQKILYYGNIMCSLVWVVLYTLFDHIQYK